MALPWQEHPVTRFLQGNHRIRITPRGLPHETNVNRSFLEGNHWIRTTSLYPKAVKNQNLFCKKNCRRPSSLQKAGPSGWSGSFKKMNKHSRLSYLQEPCPSLSLSLDSLQKNAVSDWPLFTKLVHVDHLDDLQNDLSYHIVFFARGQTICIIHFFAEYYYIWKPCLLGSSLMYPPRWIPELYPKYPRFGKNDGHCCHCAKESLCSNIRHVESNL